MRLAVELDGHFSNNFWLGLGSLGTAEPHGNMGRLEPRNRQAPARLEFAWIWRKLDFKLCLAKMPSDSKYRAFCPSETSFLITEKFIAVVDFVAVKASKSHKDQQGLAARR